MKEWEKFELGQFVSTHMVDCTIRIYPSRDTEKVEGEPSLRRGLLHGRIYLRTFARMREEEEGGGG